MVGTGGVGLCICDGGQFDSAPTPKKLRSTQPRQELGGVAGSAVALFGRLRLN